MRKFVSYIPFILTVFGFLYSFFDASAFAWLTAHTAALGVLGALFAASETLAASDAVKSNSVAEAIFDLVDTILAAVLHKPAPVAATEPHPSAEAAKSDASADDGAEK